MAGQIIDDLLDFFPHLIGVEPHLSSTGRGVASYGPLVNRSARISSGHQRIVRDENGKEVTSTIMAVFAGAFGIKALDRYTLPAGFEPTNPVAVKVVRSSDENGPHHERVFFL